MFILLNYSKIHNSKNCIILITFQLDYIVKMILTFTLLLRIIIIQVISQLIAQMSEYKIN